VTFVAADVLEIPRDLDSERNGSLTWLGNVTMQQDILVVHLISPSHTFALFSALWNRIGRSESWVCLLWGCPYQQMTLHEGSEHRSLQTYSPPAPPEFLDLQISACLSCSRVVRDQTQATTTPLGGEAVNQSTLCTYV